MMGRRLWAGLVEAAPFAVALLLTLPLVAALGLQGYENLVGTDIFDPANGGDPVLIAHLAGKGPLAIGAALGAVAWLAIEAAALLRRRQAMGTAIAGLTLQRTDGRAPSRAQALLREGVRQLLAVALVVAAALATRSGPRRAELAGVLAQMVVVIAPLLAIHVLVDLALTLAGKRSLADRLARTRVDRR